MQKVLIIGGGRFGMMAIQRLIKQNNFIRILAIVEPMPSPMLIELCKNWNVKIWNEDGIQVIQRILISSRKVPEWIIPCLPRHLLVEWLLINLADLRITPLTVPNEILTYFQHLNPLPGPHQAWHLSFTHTLCPSNCWEPIKYCLKTKQPRNKDMYIQLAELKLSKFKVAVLRSHQIAPGLGGLLSWEMLALRNLLISQSGLWLISTACRCHGVLQALSINSTI